MKEIQSTTRIMDFFVVGKMSGILVGFAILVGAPVGDYGCSTFSQRVFVYSTNQTTVKQSDFIDEYWKKTLFTV